MSVAIAESRARDLRGTRHGLPGLVGTALMTVAVATTLTAPATAAAPAVGASPPAAVAAPLVNLGHLDSSPRRSCCQ